MKFIRRIFTLCSLVTSLAMAGNTAAPKDSSVVKQDNFQRFSLVPVLGYTEETKLQYGAMLLLFLKPYENGGKVHEIGITAYGTTRDQVQLTLEPYFYLYHDKISIWANINYQNWYASYFGYGNNPDIDVFTNYDRQRFYIDNTWESTLFVPHGLKYGVEFHIENTQIQFKDYGKLELPDTHSGWRNGLGYILSYDTRDNTNWTKHGVYAQWKQLFYSDKLGDYSFTKESVDLRGYTTLPYDWSFAQSFLWQMSTGDTPFDMLSGPDGVKRFRGVESLYFGDKQAVIIQSEVRRYLDYRLGTHIFLEAGKSGDHFSELMRNKWHKAIGIGALLGLNLKEQLFARADFSWIDLDHLGVSFYVRQAF